MVLDSYLIAGYDLSGGDTNWTSDSIPGYSFYIVEYIWSNITGTLDGQLVVRQTDDSKVYDSIETITISVTDKTHTIQGVNLTKNKINVKFVANNITGGRLSVRIKGQEKTGLSDGAYLPASNKKVDLGSSTRRFKDIYAERIIGFKSNIVSKATNYTATLIDDTILCDASGGAFTITLPTSSIKYKIYNIKKTDSSANAITISGTIDNATRLLNNQYDSITFQSDGTKWWII